MSEYSLKAVFSADVSGFKDSIKDVKKSLGDVGDEVTGTESKTKKGLGGIKSAFGGLAGIVAGAFALDKIKDFGISMIEAGAESQAMTAQFEQVFGSMQTDAQQAVNGLGKEFGMVGNRIKPALTQMTSMFKGLGMDTEQAMSTATGAVTLVADAAAFYDKSFEDANASLNSFIKGNYEGKFFAPRYRNVA